MKIISGVAFILLLICSVPIFANEITMQLNTLQGKAISLAARDFNEDGVKDLAVSYESGSGKMIKIYPGNLRSIYMKPDSRSKAQPFLDPVDAPESFEVSAGIRKLYLRLNPDAITDLVFILKDGKVYVRMSVPNTIFTVSETSDLSDADTGDGVCDIDLGTSGDQCTLRAAIEQANASSGPDSISFNIPGGGIPTISPGSAYPDITDPVTIDGTTQSQSLVEIDGSASSFAVGFNVLAGSNLIRGLVINRFSDAIRINGNGSNIVEGNLIGTDTTGTVALPNEGSAIAITDSSNNQVGGTAAPARNVISGNNGIVGAIAIHGATSTANLVQGNFIGTDVTGLLPLGNGEGVLIEGPGNTIGGTDSGSRNIFADNSFALRISGVNATGNSVQGNYFGTDVNGTNQLGNATALSLLSASGNTIGGSTPASRNLISGNGTGVAISGGDSNILQGNFIGTDVSGMTAIPNSIAGVIIGSSANNMIGGASSAEGNVISGSVFVGILLTGSSTTGNQIMNNLIGVAADGVSPVGNQLHGVILSNPTGTFPTGNFIQLNSIANNGGDGIYAQGGFGNSILSNLISNNSGLGIDLGPDGVTSNDSGDADIGANALQNFPDLTQAQSSGGNTTIIGSFNSTPSTSYVLEFFHNSLCDASGNGEGSELLGSANINTDAGGMANVNVVFPIVVANGSSISATATDPNGNTSEFSECVIVGGGGSTIFSDDFSDGDAQDWTFTKGNWAVSNETLNGTVDRKGDAISPDFGGCSVCTFESNLGVQTSGGRVSLLAWYFDKRNLVEVRLMEDKDKVLLIQKSAGFKVTKASFQTTIDPDVTYNVQVSFDGTNFQVFLDGSLIITQLVGATPSGKAGFRVKSTTGTPVTGFFEDISVH